MLGDIIQPTHLLLILVVALLVLGPKRLPEVGRSLGRGLRDFRHGLQGVQDDARGMFTDALDAPAPTAVSASASAPPPSPSSLSVLTGEPSTDPAANPPTDPPTGGPSIDLSAEPPGAQLSDVGGPPPTQVTTRPVQLVESTTAPSARAPQIPSSASVTKVVSLELDPADYAD